MKTKPLIITGLVAIYLTQAHDVLADLAPPFGPKNTPYTPPSPQVSSTPSIIIVGGVAVSVSLIALLIFLRMRK